MNRLTLGAICVAIVAASYAAPGLAAPAQGRSIPSSVRDYDSLKVGDVLGVGTVLPGEAACQFDQAVGVRTEAPGPGLSRVVRVIVTPACQAFILERSEVPALPNPRDNPVKNDPSTTANKFVWQRVFTNGACQGCTWDRLTQEYGELYFTYNGQSAQMTDFWWYCDAPGGGPWWHWVVDGCPLDYQFWGPASVVWQTSHGNYHCNPPGTTPCSYGSGYYHSLYNDVDGHADGTSHCSGWFTGRIVYYSEEQYVCTDP